MTAYLIPLVAQSQQFQITLAGIAYLMTIKWNNADNGGWALDFADPNTQVSIAAYIPLVAGVDLLKNLKYLGFNGSLYVYNSSDPEAIPTFQNLGSECKLYFVTEAANV